MRLTLPSVAVFALALIASGCDAIARKELLVRSAGGEAASFQARVEKTFNLFATRNGFVCRDGENQQVARACRAPAPRFLELHRSSSSFVIFLDQPYPGGLMSKAPESYIAAAHELENSFSVEFGGAVVVVSK